MVSPGSVCSIVTPLAKLYIRSKCINYELDKYSIIDTVTRPLSAVLLCEACRYELMHQTGARDEAWDSEPLILSRRC
jgi:hypothetical protein